MDSINVSLPGTIKEFVNAEVSAGGFGTPSEYVVSLIREAQKRKAQERLESLLLEGLESESREMRDGEWEEIRREGLEQLRARNSA